MVGRWKARPCGRFNVRFAEINVLEVDDRLWPTAVTARSAAQLALTRKSHAASRLQAKVLSGERKRGDPMWVRFPSPAPISANASQDDHRVPGLEKLVHDGWRWLSASYEL